ncbi:heat-inducible transcriptional repressor HrcA [Parenemella sanctibonifatiensis]|uniref:Heat-inducible transcription repressor HrcA n=1 Tax=Parenemella sanctibonifatiensis TaxID=2016505 RepID=A0A255E134_9ACTN|nr:heat-inducible transcriptional repressor HrcA [Parenemella sanctibonifatiensis]OYN85277.1 heat-inducible transcriptional repressor HrcA [Parenemella sanctibonifatiensis]
MVDNRRLRVLHAIVTDYVSSREPVGSKALVERHNLQVSPATVRNDMVALEEEGYITQPHTSAGRIPTDKGYRLFVDQLAQVKPLSAAEKRAIASFMSGAADMDEIITRTVRLLAQVTQQVAMVQYPQLSTATVRHVELVELTAERAMVILVLSSGSVSQRPFELPVPAMGADPVADQLGRLRHRINAALVGLTPHQVPGKIASLLEDAASEDRALTSLMVAALTDMIEASSTTKIVVGGVPNLTGFGAEFETRVRPVLEALEEQVVLLHLLGEAHQPDQVTVRIGTEIPYEELQATSIVSAAYGADDDSWANLGIVGPTRMDYPSTIASVRAVARYLGRFLSEG